jgi:indolepyruvate ferredoxin oxidoreductase beta subunit
MIAQVAAPTAAGDQTAVANIVVAGIGGQGVVFLTRLLARTAVAEGHQVMVSETHGMSQRGGAVLSHLKIGGSRAPLIRRGTADLLLALDPDEAVRNLPFLRPGGALLANSADGLRAEVVAPLERLSIELRCLPAGRMAAEIGSPGVANVVMAGFAAGFAARVDAPYRFDAPHPALPLPIETLRQILIGRGRDGHRSDANRRELNLRALEAGFQAALQTSEVLETSEVY